MQTHPAPAARETGLLTIQAIGGPTAILELGGIRLLTDPTFDPPGEYDLGGRVLTKTQPAALSPSEVGRIDVVLLSHDQHFDNLDRRGRAFLDETSCVLTTRSAAARLAGTIPLATWDYRDFPRPDGGHLRVTAVPAQHGPDGTEHIVGEVTGFVLSGSGLPNVYVSGDNASLRVVARVVERFPTIDVAILFAGGARTPLLGDAYLTLNSDMAAAAARMLSCRWVVPVHFNSWQHFTEGADDLRSAFARAGLDDRLILLSPGERDWI